MTIRTNNESYKNRNKNKIKTLVGSDEVYMDLLKLTFELSDGTEVSLKDVLDNIYTVDEYSKEKYQELKKENEELTSKIKELKLALKEYIEKENTIDVANTNSIELLSTEFNKILSRVSELESKCKYL